MTLLPKVKLKAQVNFPSNAIGGTGVDVTKVNGNFVVDLAYQEFVPPLTSLPPADIPNLNALLWNKTTDVYTLAAVPSFAGGLPEAPDNNSAYGRLGPSSFLWAPVIQKIGDTMTGALTLAADPTALLHAATKQYVDAFAVAAAPFDALAYSGMQINGSMDVSQELGTTGITASSTAAIYILDGVRFAITNTAAVGAARGGQLAVSTLGGFQNCVEMRATAAFSAPASGDAVFIRFTLEGYRVARLGWGTGNAQPLSYGFWCFATIAGTSMFRVFNSAANRCWHQEFTVTVGWNWIAGAIPGDTSPTWLTTNGIGIYIDLYAMGKEASPAPPGVWSATIKAQTTNSQNLLATINNQVLITGLILLPGIEAPSAARSPLIMRPFDQELVTCRRYFQWTASNDECFYVFNPSNAIGTHRFTPTMRAPPAVTICNGTTINQVLLFGGAAVAVTPPVASTDGFGVIQSAAAFSSAGIQFNVKADTRL